MTWLMNDVDAVYGIETDEFPAGGELGLIRKMARVIRELVKIVWKLSLILPGTVVECSPDVEELLNAKEN